MRLLLDTHVWLWAAMQLLVECPASAQYGEPRGGLSSAPPRTIDTRGLAATPARRPAQMQSQLPLEQALAAPVDPKVERRLRLNAELTALMAERAKISLAGPLTLMIGGGAVLAIGASVLVLSGMHGDHSDARSTGLIGIIVGGLSLGFGSVWLGTLKPERRRLGLRIRDLRREIELLGGFGPDRASLGLRVRF